MLIADAGGGGGGVIIISRASTSGSGASTSVVIGIYQANISEAIEDAIDITKAGPIMLEYMPELANLLAMDF